MSEQPPLAPAGIFKAYDIRGLYGSEMDESTAQAIGRAFARVLGRLRGKPVGELRIGLGRDMRLTAPAMAAELRDGMIFEGATVLDAGMVATEMLYHLVGSRELDGGAMVTASHNPKAYTGVKLVREGALPLSGDAGIGDVKAEIEAGLGPAPGDGSLEEVDVWEEFRAHALSFIDPAKVRPMKVVVDGGNGMAGPMVGPILAKLGLDLEEMYFEPDGEFPDHEPNPLLEENRRLIMERVQASGADLGIAWDGDADRCFFIDASGEFCDGDFICALLARSVLRKKPGRDDPLRPPLQPRGARPGRRRGRPLRPLAGRPRLLQGADARGGRRLRRRGLRPLLLPRLLVRRLGHDPGAADAGAALDRRSRARRADGGVPLQVLHLRRDQLRGRRPGGEDGRDRASATPTGRSATSTASPSTTPSGTSTCAPSNTEPLLRLNLESLSSREDMERRRDEILGLIRG